MINIPERKMKTLALSLGIAFGVLIFACLLAGVFGCLNTDAIESNSGSISSNSTSSTASEVESETSQDEGGTKVDLGFLHKLLTPISV